MRFSVCNSLARWLLAGAAAAVLAACGGGGDGNVDHPTLAGTATVVTPVASQQLMNTFAATLSGVEEVPPTNSGALGTGTVVLDPASGVAVATLSAGLAGTAANIYLGLPGTVGLVVLPLLPSPGTFTWSGAGTLTADQVAALRAGNLYFNITSSAFPTGEIRGQIVAQLPSAATSGTTGNVVPTSPTTGGGALANLTGGSFFAVLSGPQVVPASQNVGSGAGTVLLNTVTREIQASVAVTGFTSTGAAIRLGTVGSNGPILASLSPAAPNVWTLFATLTPDQVNSLNNGGYYFSVASSTQPNGQLEGRIVPQLQVPVISNLPSTGATTGATGTAGMPAGTTGTNGTMPGSPSIGLAPGPITTGAGIAPGTAATGALPTGTGVTTGTGLTTGTPLATGIGTPLATGIGTTGSGTTTGISTGIGSTPVGSTVGVIPGTTTVGAVPSLPTSITTGIGTTGTSATGITGTTGGTSTGTPLATGIGFTTGTGTSTTTGTGLAGPGTTGIGTTNIGTGTTSGIGVGTTTGIGTTTTRTGFSTM